MLHEEDTLGNLLFRDDTLGLFVTTIVHQNPDKTLHYTLQCYQEHPVIRAGKKLPFACLTIIVKFSHLQPACLVDDQAMMVGLPAPRVPVPSSVFFRLGLRGANDLPVHPPCTRNLYFRLHRPSDTITAKILPPFKLETRMVLSWWSALMFFCQQNHKWLAELNIGLSNSSGWEHHQIICLFLHA